VMAVMISIFLNVASKGKHEDELKQDGIPH
jgi:hypothetical protein